MSKGKGKRSSFDDLVTEEPTPPDHDYLSAGDNPYASGDRAYTGCSLCGRPRSEHRKAPETPVERLAEMLEARERTGERSPAEKAPEKADPLEAERTGQMIAELGRAIADAGMKPSLSRTVSAEAYDRLTHVGESQGKTREEAEAAPLLDPDTATTLVHYDPSVVVARSTWNRFMKAHARLKELEARCSSGGSIGHAEVRELITLLED